MGARNRVRSRTQANCPARNAHQLGVAVTAVAGHHQLVAVLAAEAEVDVAGVALALVVLGHEGQAVAVLGGDLLGPVLVDGVPVGGGQGLVVAEGDLVLTMYARPWPTRPTGRPRPWRCGCAAAAARSRPCPAASSRRCSRWPGAGRGRPWPGLLVAVAEHDELELGAGVGDPAPLGQPLQLPLQHPTGRGQHRVAVLPGGSPAARAVASCQGTMRRVARSGSKTKSP